MDFGSNTLDYFFFTNASVLMKLVQLHQQLSGGRELLSDLAPSIFLFSTIMLLHELSQKQLLFHSIYCSSTTFIHLKIINKYTIIR